MDFLKDAVSKATAATQQGQGGSNYQNQGSHNYNDSHSHSTYDSNLRRDESQYPYNSNQPSFNDQSSQSDRTSTGLQQQKGFGDHLMGFLDGGASERERAQREEQERLARAEEERKRREREEAGFVGKVKDMFDGGADADRKRREEQRLAQEQQSGIGGKLSGLLGGGGSQKPPGPKGFGDHVNEAFGGGHKAEQKEDFLDKGIDAIQQHLLGQGPQHNESAFEQAKDTQIANFIRGATGMGKK